MYITPERSLAKKARIHKKGLSFCNPWQEERQNMTDAEAVPVCHQTIRQWVRTKSIDEPSSTMAA